MKKPKVSLDLDRIKQFGVEHGEKFALAAAVVILGVFVVKAATRETLPTSLSPDTLGKTSQAATTHIANSATPPADQDVVGVDKGLDIAKQIKSQPTEVSPQLAIKPITQEPFPPRKTRADPALYAIEELRGEAFRGAIPSAAEGIGFVQAPQPTAAAAAPQANPAPAAAPAPVGGGLLPQRGGRVTRTRASNFGRPNPAAPAGGLLNTAPLATATITPAAAYPSGLPGPAGTGAADGHYGIVVTGLIPVGKQIEEYGNRFKSALRSVPENGAAPGIQHDTGDSDVPKYAWCLVERQDMTTGATTAMNFGDTEIITDFNSSDPELQESTRAVVKENGIGGPTMKQIMMQQQQWGGAGSTEVVSKEFLEPAFSLKLPPVLLRNWGPEAAHLPQIPLIAAAGADGQGAATPAPGGFLQPGATQPALSFDTSAHPAPSQNVATSPNGATATNPDYKLLRFVDLDVEPGHAYRYRVKMLLRNPNFGLEPQVLANTATRSVAYRPTKWSDPSPAISVQPGTRLVAGSIERPKHQLEKAKIGVFIFDVPQAVELIKQFDTELGALVGTTIPDQTIKNVADPVKHQVRDVTADFRTPSALLDFRGEEEKLPGTSDMMDPGEMLLLDDVDHPENPRLIVINEARDKAIIDEWTATHVPPAAAVPAPDATKPVGKSPASPFTNGGGGLLPGNNAAGRRPIGR